MKADTRKSDFYLFAVSAEITEESASSVFYRVSGETLAHSLCDLFTRQYTEKTDSPTFRRKQTASISLAEQILLDEAIECLALYDDPDPGIYDPSPPKHILTLAQYALRAKKWEQLLRDRLEEHELGESDKNVPDPLDSSSHDLPEMPPEERKVSGLTLLLLLSQAYYKMLESTISMASWCAALDLDLNDSYFWTVKSITNLLKNHEDLRDFPGVFDPPFPDLYPSTIRDVEWEDMIAPGVEEFLSTVQQYVSSKGIYELEKGSTGWVFIELFRPAVDKAIERAIAYNKRMNDYCRQMFDAVPTAAQVSAPTQTRTKTVVELDLVGYGVISNNLEDGLDVATVASLNQQIQSFIELGLKAVGASPEEHVMSLTGDGGILVFESATAAHQFALAVHKATQEHNRTRKQFIGKRVFRIGAASGEIVMKRKPGGGYEIAGTTIARAVRLEAKALPGGFLIDAPTFEALDPTERRCYSSKQMVVGKRDEMFEAYAAQLNPDGPSDVGFLTRQQGMTTTD